MKLKQYLISILDGILQGFCGTKVLLGIAFSQFADKISLQPFLIIGCVIALITAIFYFLLIHKERNNKNLFKFSAISFLCFAVSSPILFALPFTIFPQREIRDAEGIGLMLVLAFFFITALVVRSGILVGVWIKNKKAQTLQNNPN